MGRKTIVDTDGKYEITEDGRIWSVKRQIFMKYRKDKDGYLRTNIFNSQGKHVTVKAHQLVAKHFIANPHQCKVVNHIDFNIENNHVSNLEWCDAIENHAYSAKEGRTLCSEAKKVIIKNIEYPSVSSAARANNLNAGQLFFRLNSDKPKWEEYKYKEVS